MLKGDRSDIGTSRSNFQKVKRGSLINANRNQASEDFRRTTTPSIQPFSKSIRKCSVRKIVDYGTVLAQLSDDQSGNEVSQSSSALYLQN